MEHTFFVFCEFYDPIHYVVQNKQFCQHKSIYLNTLEKHFYKLLHYFKKYLLRDWQQINL